MAINWLKALGSIRLPSFGGRGRYESPIMGVAGSPRLSSDISYAHDRALENADKSSLVMTCVEWIASMFPLARWQLERRDGDDWVAAPRHPVLDLLELPTPWHSGADLLAATMIDWNLHGTGYWVIVGNGEPSELWWRPASSITPKRDSSGLLSHYDYKVEGETIRLNQDDVLQVRRHQHPDNPWLGISPLASLGREIWTDSEAVNYSSAMVRNMGIPGWIASPKDVKNLDLGEEDFKAIREYLRDEYTANGRGSTLVLQAPMDIFRIAFSPSEMHLKGIHDFSEQRICGVFRLPAAVVQFGTGLEQTTENATLEQYEKQAWQTGLKPIHRSLAAQVSRVLLPKFDMDLTQWRLSFNFDEVEVLHEDIYAVTRRNLDRFNAGGITRYELRQAEGFDASDLDKIYLLPPGYSEVPADGFPEEVLREREEREAAANAAALATTIGDAIDEDDDSDENGDGEDTEPVAARYLRRSRKRDRLLTRFARSSQRLSDEFTDEFADEFHGLGQRTGALFRELNSGRVIRQSRALKQLSGEDEELVRRIVEELDVSDFEERVMGTKGRDLQLRSLTATADDIAAVLDVRVNIPDPTMRRVIADGGTRLLGIDVHGQARKDVFAALHEGRSNGEGVEDLVDRISDKVSRGRWRSAEVRSRVIARTETMHAQNVSTLTSYEHVDEIHSVEARDNQIGYDDADCSERDGQVFSLAEAKAISDHPNGTLLWLPVFDE